jgi:hypothetical protein
MLEFKHAEGGGRSALLVSASFLMAVVASIWLLHWIAQ